MKKTFTFFAAVLVTVSVFAQSPQKMSYQSVIRDGSNNLVTSHTVGMKISILQGSGTGTEVYKEIYNPNPQTNANGLVTIEIGSGIPLTGTFATIDWAAGPYFIKTEIDPLGGTTYTISGISQLLSVPYALHAKTAETFTGTITETDPIWTASPSYGITNTNITNWTTAYGWGNHAGLYRPIVWVPAWTDVTGKPTFATIATSGSYTDLINKPTILAGTASGQMQYWNDTAWVTVASGLNGQILKYKNGVPTWTDGNINDLSIGDSYQGGIIAYILQSGDPGYIAGQTHGLIAAPSDQSTGIQWYNGTYTTTGATATALGTGNANTNTIVTNQGAGSYAAQLCVDLVLGGYSDWYLPSKDELNKLYLNKVAIGGFANNNYWSSSDYDTNSARAQYFGNGGQANPSKNVSTVSVRAVRAF